MNQAEARVETVEDAETEVLSVVTNVTRRVDVVVSSDDLHHADTEHQEARDSHTNDVVGEEGDHHAAGVDEGETGPAEHEDQLPDGESLEDAV